jgi:uncharacterized oligopeptide transporter (OPT) family protein
MRLKTILFSLVILTAVFLSAFGSPASPQSVKFQNTAQPPAVTLVPPTVVVVTTPGAIPVTGTGVPGIWTLILFGLLALLGIAFLVALFSPRTIVHEHEEYIDRNAPPPPPEV